MQVFPFVLGLDQEWSCPIQEQINVSQTIFAHVGGSGREINELCDQLTGQHVISHTCNGTQVT